MDHIADLLLFSDFSDFSDAEASQSDGDSPPNSPTPGPSFAALKPPNDNPLFHLQDVVWDTFLKADRALKSACEAVGFAVAVVRSENYSKILEDYSRKTYECYKGKEVKFKASSKRKSVKTVCENCLWLGALTYYIEKKG
ncbi:hypothetical protein F5X96DRAFT_311458 [Biscogniauxia mediterranea]|nr:hypothetical protein F5X96DRAFT_311458 [Biscogniauxia mediterranea]